MRARAGSRAAQAHLHGVLHALVQDEGARQGARLSRFRRRRRGHARPHVRRLRPRAHGAAARVRRRARLLAPLVVPSVSAGDPAADALDQRARRSVRAAGCAAGGRGAVAERGDRVHRARRPRRLLGRAAVAAARVGRAPRDRVPVGRHGRRRLLGCCGMPVDAYDLPVSSRDAEALALYDRAVRALLSWQADALSLFRAAADRDPGLALAHAGAAVCLFLEERFAETKAATEAARGAATGQTERERSHVAALTAWTSGQVPEAERLMREHLATWPRDAMVFQRLYYVYFWLGKFPEMLRLTTSLLGQYPGSSFVLGLHAFALEEADRLPEAIATAERAIALEPN